MSHTTNGAGGPVFTKKVWAWGLWDWGSAAFNAIVTTFVFSVYLTNANLFGPQANQRLGYALTIAGLLVAVVAPVLGQAVDRSGKSGTVMRVTTLATALITACLYFVVPGQAGLWLGLFLLAAGNIAFETGSVVYNAIITDISSPENVGRVSGFGWGLGYIGGIVLLAILYVGFISPDVGWFGVTSENGLNVRAAMLVAALWTVVFSAPLLLTLKNKPPRTDTPQLGLIDSYKELFASIRRLWRADRGVVWFLLSSAIYRDGLAGVFAFGAVLAGTAFGFEADEVIMFGIAANLVAGIATIVFGWLDDLLGARTVIIISLASMVACGLVIFFFHDGVGPLSPKGVYWIFGLLLCVFVGPTQSASRTYLARIAPPGDEGEIFGLYATTGRAVSFLSPFMYSTAITIGAAALGIGLDDAAYFGILGIALVLLIGLVGFLPVKAQPKAR
ncbi:MFS transporter [Trueperella bialowiezensis]|uniref:MFS transporter, metabolite:H+ symporter (MHS) family protein n=1 Tax=Trueperella bialowiezensis TaxID=312285 RepID=A0A448PDX6_9ACTO|nr:MFS transporter [Trueperella bialowiezensis]VEI13128.1 MFS transporter, metabolite:H+ symporter (MHS) family protein [Trueperella bialowiezensis]